MSDRIFNILNEIGMVIEGLQSDKDLVNLELTNLISDPLAENSDQIKRNISQVLYQSKQSSTSLIQSFNLLQSYISEDL